MSIFEDVHQSGQNLAGADDARLAGMLNDVLGRFIGDHYKAVSGSVIDRDGRKSQRFASVIHKASTSIDATNPHAYPADAVAAIIDVCGELDLDNFRAAYGRITDAKTLKKTAVPKGETKTNITL
jgi:hypothetical protein